eukprot:scaffold283659_cov17-Tisochrysis_lutea.AAC.1
MYSPQIPSGRAAGAEALQVSPRDPHQVAGEAAYKALGRLRSIRMQAGLLDGPLAKLEVRPLTELQGHF